ncbi:3,7-dimethylxanthine N-methyltransferase-like [Abrus precatorius]|uniref:3,7-dimethylxanthine N-methyltransferase-like n=1 Tax=Abrus precatorius TaxID=3816 RepID=A0A8B8LKV3_ABRPR|nr:3,7-dimethylxanthine N-methyltransferase-like [Abrus precatorius]
MAIEQVLHMNGGVGDTSYANNSTFQRKVMLTAKHILEDSIMKLYCSTLPNCLKVADLGCSSGPNALLVASNVINIVDAVSQTLHREPPVFQFFLNDLFGNDFNTTFKSLPDFYKTLQDEKGDKFGPCFFSATPGSFYGRLFPDDTIHFFHSSFSLHWLSKTPNELTDTAEPINKGAIYLTKTSPPAVHKAYFAQFQEDFKFFLRSRSSELLPGGAMVLTFIGRDENNDLINAWVIIGMALKDMAEEKLIEQAKLDSFNIPSYCPTPEEIRQTIEEEGSFDIQRLETIRTDWVKNINVNVDDSLCDEDTRAEAVAKYIRAVAEPILKSEFGEVIMDELFRRFKNKIVQLYGVEKLELPNLVMHITKRS